VDSALLPPDRRWPPRGVTADRAVAALAAAVVALEIVTFGYGSDTIVVVVLGVFVAACLAWRRTKPLVAIAAAMGAYALQALVDVTTNDLIGVTACLLVLVYSVAMWEQRRAALAGLALALIAVSALLYAEGGKPLGDYVYVGLLIGATWGLGRGMRARVVQVSILAQQAARAELEREHAASAAAAEERNRIARELHDIVSHGLSVMVVQAAAAEGAVKDAPSDAESALRSIQDVGREAQSEMVRMLSVLRDGHGEAGGGLAPTPGLEDIAALVDRMRLTGLPVDLSLDGDPQPLPAGVGLTAYRLVQEALTNVRRHAGAVATEVRLAHSSSCLQVTVTNAPGTALASPGAGVGLTGMRERVATCGGTLAAGPSPDGGFVVTAELPVPTT
jgi:signal transduction histidine kinase